MKKTTMLILLLLPVCLMAQDYDFAKKIGGNTLYFYITSTGGKNGPTVEVTYPGSSEDAPWKGFHKPSGQLSIPDMVTPDRSRGRDADPEDDDTTVYTVTAIRYSAFAGCDRITRLTLPSTIKRLAKAPLRAANALSTSFPRLPNRPSSTSRRLTRWISTSLCGCLWPPTRPTIRLWAGASSPKSPSTEPPAPL